MQVNENRKNIKREKICHYFVYNFRPFEIIFSIINVNRLLLMLIHIKANKIFFQKVPEELFNFLLFLSGRLVV